MRELKFLEKIEVIIFKFKFLINKCQRDHVVWVIINVMETE